MKELTECTGLTSIAVMHVLNLALRFADSFVFLVDGRVHAAGGHEVVTSRVVADA
ncbi:MAG TPA: hypothetical protein VFC82_08105 [Actinomycetaceae bacterium]|nr:hypothetical protein [Actinomycetaceae bacterium]